MAKVLRSLLSGRKGWSALRSQWGSTADHIARSCKSQELLAETLQRAPELRLILNRYVLIQGLQLAQIAACNRLHEIEQRLARWLLMCQDRVESDILLVTHDFLAQMLGTGRPSVSLAAGTLQRSGMIENLRGRVRIVNRTDLENAACECYRALKQFNGSLGIRYT